MNPGTVVGQRWIVLERIGSGGAGSVYRAQHVMSRRLAAVKVIHAHVGIDPVMVHRFRREASLAAEIGHEGIVEVLDAGIDTESGAPFLAMELLEGESLRRRLARPGTTRADAVALLRRTLDPLAAAHARSIVHRDLKPENVFVLNDDRVKLLDFGLARNLNQDSVTVTGIGLGTPRYMAPEMAMGSKDATAAADVWAMGVMLYEVITGRMPFAGETPHALLVSACISPHVPVGQVMPDVGPRLAALLDRCLAKRPEGRPADAAVLGAELDEALAADPPLSATLVHVSAPPAHTGMAVTMSSDAHTEHASPGPSLVAIRDSWVRVVKDGWSVEVPPHWAERSTAVPGVVGLFVDPEPLDGVELGLRVKIEPFEGDSRTYGGLGMDNMAAVATLHRTIDATLGGLAGIEVEATFHTADPPFRALTRAAAAEGRGRVAVGFGPVGRFREIAPILRAILDSLRFDDGR